MFIYTGKALYANKLYKKARSAFAAAIDLLPSSKEYKREFEKAEQEYLASYYRESVKDLPIEVKSIDLLAGKGVFATKSFNFGDTVFAEEPLVSHILLANKMVASFQISKHSFVPKGAQSLQLLHEDFCFT